MICPKRRIDVKSVLGKLLQQEFGRERYLIYTEKLKQKESMDIFCDIYVNLQERSEQNLNEALKKLLDSVQTSIRISKDFLYITLGFFVTMFVLLLFGASWMITLPAMILVGLCYLYKLKEYIKNRFCDKDVRIVLIYKIALFHLLEEKNALTDPLN